jgi:hypothetical protein
VSIQSPSLCNLKLPGTLFAFGHPGDIRYGESRDSSILRGVRCGIEIYQWGRSI